MLKPAMNKACVYFLILQHTDNSTWIILIYQTWPRPPFFLPWHVVALLDGVETPNTKLGVALEDHRPTYSTRSRDIQFLGPGVTLEQHEFRYRERSEEISMGGFRGKKMSIRKHEKSHFIWYFTNFIPNNAWIPLVSLGSCWCWSYFNSNAKNKKGQRLN